MTTMTDARARTGPLPEILEAVQKMTAAEREQFLAWLEWQRRPWWRRMLDRLP